MMTGSKFESHEPVFTYAYDAGIDCKEDGKHDVLVEVSQCSLTQMLKAATDPTFRKWAPRLLGQFQNAARTHRDRWLQILEIAAKFDILSEDFKDDPRRTDSTDSGTANRP